MSTADELAASTARLRAERDRMIASFRAAAFLQRASEWALTLGAGAAVAAGAPAPAVAGILGLMKQAEKVLIEELS